MSDLKWASANNANVKEPIEALKQNGWQYGDIPTASNFNWLFKQVSTEINNIKYGNSEADKKIEDIKNWVTEAFKLINEQREVTQQNSEAINKLRDWSYGLDKYLKR